MKQHQLIEPIAIPYTGAEADLSALVSRCVTSLEYVGAYTDAADKVITAEEGCPYCNEGLKREVFYNLNRVLLPLAEKYKLSLGVLFAFPTHLNTEGNCLICDGSVLIGEPEVLAGRAITVAKELVDAVTITTAVQLFDAAGEPVPEELGRMHNEAYTEASPFSPEGSDIRRLLGE